MSDCDGDLVFFLNLNLKIWCINTIDEIVILMRQPRSHTRRHTRKRTRARALLVFKFALIVVTYNGDIHGRIQRDTIVVTSSSGDKSILVGVGIHNLLFYDTMQYRKLVMHQNPVANHSQHIKTKSFLFNQLWVSKNHSKRAFHIINELTI